MENEQTFLRKVRQERVCPHEIAKENIHEDGGQFGAGYLEGYLASYGNVDRDDERIAQGAFAKSISEVVQAGRVPLMSEHKLFGGGTRDVVGLVTEAREDPKGLWVRADFSSVASAQEARTKVREGIVRGLSVGMRVLQSRDAEEEGKQIRELTECALHEGTLTPFPCNTEASVVTAKSERDELISRIVEIEKRLDIDISTEISARRSTGSEEESPDAGKQTPVDLIERRRRAARLRAEALRL